MKKVVVVMIILFVIVLSFWVGKRYGNERSAGAPPRSGAASAGLNNEGGDDSPSTPVPGTVNVSPEQQQLIGVKVAVAEKKPATYTLRLYGKVVPDETKLYRVNASTDCWIKMISSATTGSMVRNNQVLAEVLAPAYYNAQVTYLLALNNIDRIKRQLGGETRHQQNELADNQIRMAVQGLQNLGISDAQTEELANTRQARPYLQVRSPTRGVILSRKVTLNQWFKAAEELYTIADIGKVWVYADVYEDEAMHMRPGMAVMVRQGNTGKAFGAKVGQVLPLFDPGARTLKVRIDVDNSRYDLRPDMFVDVEIPITMAPSVNVPSDAVLDTGTQTIVYVDKGNGVFEPRRVKTGWNLGGRVAITEGIMPGEKVVVSGNFLIDSESRMAITASGTQDDEDGQPVRTATPEKRTDRNGNRGALPETNRSWAEMLDHGKGKAGAKSGGTRSKRVTGDSPLKTAPSPGVVDWDGPDQDRAPRDWTGWGKFPGADYLGIKRENKDEPPPSSKLPETVDGKPTVKHRGGSEANPLPGTPPSGMKTGQEGKTDHNHPPGDVK